MVLKVNSFKTILDSRQNSIDFLFKVNLLSHFMDACMLIKEKTQNSSLDSSIGSASASYSEGLRFKSQQG